MLQRRATSCRSGCSNCRVRQRAAAGGPFNVDSPKAAAGSLFRQTRLPVTRRALDRTALDGRDVLEELADEYELPRLVLENTVAAALRSTYTDKLPGRSQPAHRSRTRRITSRRCDRAVIVDRPEPAEHPDPDAGRPADRQTPVHAQPRTRIVAADYSQIELRIMAHFNLSGDEGCWPRSPRTGTSTGDGRRRFRRGARRGEPGPAAGRQGHQLRAHLRHVGVRHARQLGIERGRAAVRRPVCFQRYPGVKRYMDETCAAARSRATWRRCSGRLHLRRSGPGNQQRQYAERNAINAPMQGNGGRHHRSGP